MCLSHDLLQGTDSRWLLLQTVATGLVPDNNAVLPEPLKLGKSLVYLTDTVLLPSSSGGAVPNPARRRR
jgi:hypothetical protein